MKLRAIVGSILLLLSVFGVGGVLAYAKYSSIRAQMLAPPPQEMPESVVFASVKTVKTRAVTSSVGTAVAPRWITLQNEIAGSILRFSFESGKIVEAGQVLLELESSVETAQLQYAQARQRIAESTFKRSQLAAVAKALTELEVEQAEAELDQSKAEVARLQATIDKKSLRAPFRARAGLINVHTGQYIQEGTEITTLQGVDDKIHVDFMLPQHVADQISVGNTVNLLLPSGSVTAHVIALDSKSDRSTRNLLIRAELRDPPPSLMPNDSVTVEIPYGAEMTLMAVPSAAVRRSPSGAFVYVVQPDKEGKSRALMRTVAVGRSHENLVTIIGGLTDSDRVISEGSFKLRDGALVADQPPSSTQATEESVEL